MAKSNFTKPAKCVQTETKIVEGAPVKITRARDGSRGTDIREELVERPKEGNWLDVDELGDSSIIHGMPSGYGRWIAEAEAISTLPEMLTSEEVMVQDAAESKLRELKDKKSKEGEPNSRFDIIDIPEEAKE